MAIEAMFQKNKTVGQISEDTHIHQLSWRLRNVAFFRALIIEESIDSAITLSLNPYLGTQDSWHEFKVSSATDGVSNEHCQGLIRLRENSAISECHDVV
jgi:hypothetical protein